MPGRLLAVLIVATAVLGAQSQPPAPGAGEREGAPPREQAQPAQSQPEVLIGTEATPAVVRIAESPEQAAQEQAGREQQATTNRRLVWLTGLLALFTLALVYVGWKQRQTYEAALATNKEIERAYVDMSPKPGSPLAALTPLEVVISIKNYGRTPANSEPLSRETINSLNDRGGSLKCWIIGWVDYVDRFGKRTRHRFTRRYEPASKTLSVQEAAKHNFFVVESKPGYNGDHNRCE